MTQADNQQPKRKLQFTLDLRLVVILLLVIIAVMLALWRPWQYSPRATDRTISVIGEATVKAEPDEYLFTPSYEFKNKNRQIALNALIKKGDEIVAKLEDLGVADNRIKTNANDYNKATFLPESPDGSTVTYTLSIEVNVANRELAQKVQNYLITTDPGSSITPQPTFSQSKRNQLEVQARNQATEDARTKAEQSAKNLGFRMGDVKSVNDGYGFGITPYLEQGSGTTVTRDAKPQLDIQPGENELNYSVSVVYFIR